MAEVDLMSQVTSELASWLYSCQRPWFDSRFRAVLPVHADRVWLPSVKSQACKLEAHYEVREAYERKSICVSAKLKLLFYYQSWKRLWDITSSSLFRLQMKTLRFRKLRSTLKETSWEDKEEGLKPISLNLSCGYSITCPMLS